jgi:hypothetical protein
MRTIINILLLSLLSIWEFPQILLGLLVLAIAKTGRKTVRMEREKQLLFVETTGMGVSLGWFIFWSPSGNRYPYYTNDCRMHEYGHSRQSAMLGPLYLIVVGIPSLSRVAYSRYYCKKHGHAWKHYFDAFPENWADTLGGIRKP